jgi:adenosylcobinamide-GDP ribazoletransferase
MCDGLFAPRTAAERLAIMKDPHIGTFGLAGGILVLLGKFAAIQTLLTRSPTRTAAMIVAAAVVARCLVLTLAGGAHYPRDQGTGKTLIESTSSRDGWAAALVALLAAALAAAAGVSEVVDALIQTALLFAPVFLVVVLIRRTCERRLGGVTGDCLGAAIEGTEAVFLLTAALAT